MSISLRGMCTALGLSGDISICTDVLGFSQPRFPAPIGGRPRTGVSMKAVAEHLRATHFSVRIIEAGSDLLTTAEQDALDYAVFRLRDIYLRAGVGIGRIRRESRTAANSSGHATVTTDSDLTNTGHDVTADGPFVPVVIPANMNVSTTNPDGTVSTTLGRSPNPGPCSPRTQSGMRSSVVALAGDGTGRTLAHEVGHFLGAPHPATFDNSLMTQTGSVTSGNPFDAVAINAGDLSTMLGHCTMRSALTGF